MRSRPAAIVLAPVLSALLGLSGLAMVAQGLRPRTPPGPARVTGSPPAVNATSELERLQPSPAPTRTSPAPEPALPRSAPVRLEIPALGVASRVTPVGLRGDGTIEAPPLGKNAPVGWYRPMASPGEPGAAVMVGHVDSARDGPAVFYRLGRLRPGDRILVHRKDSRTVTFSVLTVARYPKSHFPTSAVYGPTPSPALRLITCGGTFDRARHSYRDNLVVYAVLVHAEAPGR